MTCNVMAKEKEKMINNDQLKTTHTSNDWATRTPLTATDDLGFPISYDKIGG